MKEYGFVSWHTHSNYGNTAPDDPRYLPLFRKAAELGVYVYLHPQLPEGSRYAGYGFTFAGPGLGFTVDTVTTLLRMVVSGLFDEIPSLRLVLGHLGEGLPFCWTVLKTGSNFCPIRPFAAAARCATTFSTTSGLLPAAICRRSFPLYQDVLGMDHILFASDYPYESVEDMMAFLRGIPLNEADYARLYYQNAEALLGISLS